MQAVHRPGRCSVVRCAALALFLAMALPGLAGCGGTTAPAQLTQTVGELTATLAIHPTPPEPMQDTRFELALQHAGQPVSGATVHLTLTMPDCSMAPSYPEVVEQAAGVYAAETVLSMAGAWQADAAVALPGQEEIHLVFLFSTRQ